MLCNRIKQFRTYNKIETKTLAKALNIEHSQYISAGFENNVRHMWLPTQVNWMFNH